MGRAPRGVKTPPYCTEPGFGFGAGTAVTVTTAVPLRVVVLLTSTTVPSPDPGTTNVGTGLVGVGAPVTLPGPPPLITELPARFPVPTELALLLITTAPGTIGATALIGVKVMPAPIDPCPFTTPPPVMLELSAVLAIPIGPGVGVATLTA